MTPFPLPNSGNCLIPVALDLQVPDTLFSIDLINLVIQEKHYVEQILWQVHLLQLLIAQREHGFWFGLLCFLV
jgi:hypothetical protein